MPNPFEAAVRNVASQGDTDIFPYPIENHVFYDRPVEAAGLLDKVNKDFGSYLLNIPPLYENNLAPQGYTSFRWATQIDPMWNAYLLGLVISIGPEIEAARIPTSRDRVFTYRFNYEKTTNQVFDPGIGWKEFQQSSREYAQTHKYVLICDIADFYPRIYHHRLENALLKATKNEDVVRRIMAILSRLSDGVSFGLPVGGPAARLLSELLLNRMDRLLTNDGIEFCRFADDYHIFADNREEAYENLVFLSAKLLENEGLSLQKSKTRVLTSEEFFSVSETTELRDTFDAKESSEQKFLALSLRYDPYSPTADQDYEKLKDEIGKFDIVGMLAREMSKSRVHQALTRKLITSVKYLSPNLRNAAIESLVDNFQLLYPLFPSVMLLIKNVISDLEERTRASVFTKTRDLIESGSYITQVAVNLGFAVRLLSKDTSEDTEELFAKLYKETDRVIIRRDIILAMARRNADYWISDRRKNFGTMPVWEKRSVLVASFILRDEGKHWRDKIKKELGPMDELILQWASEKSKDSNWVIPI